MYSIPRGASDPKFMGPFDQACQYPYFYSLGSEIGHTVIDLLKVDQNYVGWTNGWTNASPI